jgi:TonB family protein
MKRRSHQIAILFTFLSVVILCSTLATGQNVPQTLRLASRREIPSATLPCTPEEASWWEDLRTTARKYREKRERKEREHFRQLLDYGVERGYGAPVADRKPTTLSLEEPQYTEEARRRRISGIVMLLVEFRSDGFIGEVTVTRSLDDALDEKAIEAARRVVFLPAVRDGKFVNTSQPVEMSFRVY